MIWNETPVSPPNRKRGKKINPQNVMLCFLLRSLRKKATENTMIAIIGKPATNLKGCCITIGKK